MRDHILCRLVLTFVFLAGSFSCREKADSPAALGSERGFRILPIDREVGDKRSEISGLAWQGDTLLLLAQYPNRFHADGVDNIFWIDKKDILAFLDQNRPGLLQAHKFNFFDDGVTKSIPDFQGFESIVVKGKDVFLTIEVYGPGKMSAYIVKGTIGKGIHLDASTLIELPMPVNLDNMAFETLLRHNNRLIAIFEANGINVNPDPFAFQIDLDNGHLERIHFPTIEYRITDATDVDQNNRFWVINYHWPGENSLLNPGPDPLNLSGQARKKGQAVERLLEMEIREDGVYLSGKPALRLPADLTDYSRNWEGLVRLDDRGFLLMTDRAPETILAFIPLN